MYWTANTGNPRGQITKETLGNGVVTNRAYDAVTGWVSSIEAGVSGGSGAQNNAYLYDDLGNVTQRQDNNQGLTENFYYDTDYRLDHSTLGGATNLQMTYDSSGNIMARSDVASGATWTYDPVRKHAVTQAGSSSYTYTYDGNGNAITRNGFALTWTSYNYPSGVNAAGESVTFQYGPDRQRWKTIYTGSIGTETTYHVGKLLEKVANSGTMDYRHYIFAGNELVSIYSRLSTGTNTVRYALQDHQGSFAGVLTSMGTPDVRESFTAFGNRRSGETWSGAPSTTDETAINTVSRQGYTGQTMLGVSMGLNHMNGRIQDAITGRFLSPDPSIPDPGDTQSFNRYSYVNNNPLTYTDPSGFDPCNQGDDNPGGCIPGIVVNGVPPESDVTPSGIPGGYIITSPTGDLVLYGTAPRTVSPAKPAPPAPPADTTVSIPKPPVQVVLPKSATVAQSPKPTQCINSDGSIGNDSPGNLPNGNLRTLSLNLEDYIGFGFTFQFGAFYDRTTGNYGLFDTFGLGGGLGGSGSVNVGTASNLSSFQGITGQVEAGVGPIAGTYVFNANNPQSPVGYSGGVGANLLGVLPVPAAANVSRTFTNILTSNLPRCH